MLFGNQHIHTLDVRIDDDIDSSCYICFSLMYTHSMKELGMPSNTGDVSFGQLYGMGNHITYPLGEAGCHAYKIVPYGPVMEVVPYLLRRASENSSGMVNADQERRLLNKELLQRLCLKS